MLPGMLPLLFGGVQPLRCQHPSRPGKSERPDFGTSTYPARELRCQAVADRAAQLPNEYAREARTIDRSRCSTAIGTVGPVENRLHDFAPVKGLVFGHFGEASPDAHKLVAGLAAAVALRQTGRDAQADELQAIHGALAWRFKQCWAMTAVRAAARLTLDRPSFVGDGASAAVAPRERADGRLARARRQACADMLGTRLACGRRGLW